MSKRVLKKVLLIIMLLSIMTMFTACMSGTYVSESGYYEVKLKPFGNCTWIQGGDSFFEGKYEKEENGVYNLLLKDLVFILILSL